MNTLIKTGKTILNAMAFANAGNMQEFRSLLQASEAHPVGKSAQPDDEQDIAAMPSLAAQVPQAV